MPDDSQIDTKRMKNKTKRKEKEVRDWIGIRD
jgi:translation elongation factor EF-1beta